MQRVETAGILLCLAPRLASEAAAAQKLSHGTVPKPKGSSSTAWHRRRQELSYSDFKPHDSQGKYKKGSHSGALIARVG